MDKYSYLFINFLTVLFPLAFSFLGPIKFYRKFKSYLVALVVVGTYFIIWDQYFTIQGYWGFNENYLTGVKIINLPIEEVLFFVCIPFACIFMYEAIKTQIKESQVKFNKQIFLPLSLLFFIISFLTIEREYSSFLLFSTGLFILVLYKDRTVAFLHDRRFYYSIVTMFVGFYLVNYILTSTPIVTYNSDAFSGIRITSIPLEDHLYSLLMYAAYIYVYEKHSTNKTTLKNAKV